MKDVMLIYTQRFCNGTVWVVRVVLIPRDPGPGPAPGRMAGRGGGDRCIRRCSRAWRPSTGRALRARSRWDHTRRGPSTTTTAKAGTAGRGGSRPKTSADAPSPPPPTQELIPVMFFFLSNIFNLIFIVVIIILNYSNITHYESIGRGFITKTKTLNAGSQ